ncbi:MAG: hypothetical protein FWC30_03415 [Candidatus Bathyarchaeota archaeon]|nr:hypothetical protein [Candidatus Termiticorpusculum sp.]
MLIDMPIIVCGKAIYGEDRETITINLENDVEVRVPTLNEQDVANIIDSRLNTGLHKTHFDDITLFFMNVAKFWFSPSSFIDNAVKIGAQVTGYPEVLITRDYRMLAELFANRCELYDQLEAELGNRWYIDEWVSSQTCLIHAQPRGLVTNILVGNIPIASTFGIYRSLVVKNNTLCKIPKRDPVSALFFGLSFLEVAPNHPITKSLSIVYWEKDSWQEKKLLDASDAVCLWGGEQSINEIKRKIKMGTKILEYGPKRSLSMVDLSEIDATDSIEDIALRVGHDFSVYNQEGCFTSQEMYLVANDDVFDEFIVALKSALDHYLRLYPKGQIMLDNKAHVLLTRKEQIIRGAEVMCTDNHNWTIIVTKDRQRLPSHPLSRTVVIHRVSKLEEALAGINSLTQTVTLYPWKAQERLRDDITLNGADRIVAIGMANFPRIGFPHDGIWTFNQLVRWVNVERDIDFKGKYLNLEKDEFIMRLFKSGKEPMEVS